MKTITKLFFLFFFLGSAQLVLAQWFDAGTYVRLNTSSDDVHIGSTAAPGSKLRVTDSNTAGETVDFNCSGNMVAGGDLLNLTFTTGSSDAAEAIELSKGGSHRFHLYANGKANLLENGTGTALEVNGDEALWYNGTYFSWGFAGENYFANNVGIGETNPDSKLHIKSGTSGGQVIKLESGNGSGYIGFNEGISLRGWLQRTSTDNMDLTNNFTGDIIVRTNGDDVLLDAQNEIRFLAGGSGEDMILNAAGNVGLGTLTPSVRFHVNGGQARIQNSSPNISFRNVADDDFGTIKPTSTQWELETGSGQGIRLDAGGSAANASNIIMEVGNSNKLVIDGTVTATTNNMVVGGTDPGVGNLKTRGTSELELALDAVSGNPDFTMQEDNQSKAQFRYNVSLNGLEILANDNNVGDAGLTAGSRAVFISGANRRVHIGGANPQAKLDVEGDIHYSGTISNTSDRRLKKDVKDFKYGLETIKSLKPISYHYNGKAGTNAEKEHVGIFAQDLQEVAPELVGTFEHVTFANQSQKQLNEEAPIQVEKTEKFLNIQESAIKYMLINSVKELAAQVDAKDERIETLEAELNSMKDAIAQIQAQMAVNPTSNTTTTLTEKDVVLNGEGNVAELAQNHPNPFNENTVINYFLPEGSTGAHMNIFTAGGKVLKTIKIEEAGKGQINLKANSLPAGSYMYQLVTDAGIVGSKTMVLAK